MIFTPTPLKNAFIIDLKTCNDERGFFARQFCQKEYEAQGLNGAVVQINTSFNEKAGTLRGMHYQTAPFQEVKSVRCIRGAIYDVIVDLRPESETYKQWFGITLEPGERQMLYVPEDFAHGFLTLEYRTEVIYFVSQFYQPGKEGGLRYDDPEIGIKWPRSVEVISEKDRSWPELAYDPR